MSTCAALKQERFNCFNCEKNDGKDEEFNRDRRKRNGCFGYENPLSINDVTFDRCVGNFFDFEYLNLAQSLAHYKKGVYLYSGSIHEQPAKYVQAMELINEFLEDN